MAETSGAERWMWVLAAAILVATVVWNIACTSTESPPSACEDTCAWNNACPGALHVTCSTYCPAAASSNLASGCTAAYSDYLDCKAQHQSEVCLAADESCVSLLVAYYQCLSTYCSQNPTSAECS
jgi:hypothetical protein